MIIKFDDTETEQRKFHQNKSPISINDIDIIKIVVSNKLPYGKQDSKYFICIYNNITFYMLQRF